jgi:uncharacterized membrane protein YidH (DUF202 family)
MVDEIKFEDAFPFIVGLSTTMFVISGINKLLGRGNDLERLSSRLPSIPSEYLKLVIISAGILELIASFGMIYSSLNPIERGEIGAYSSLSLVIFTVLATLIFYVNPFKYFPFISNLDTVSGLLLIFLIFKKIGSSTRII